MLHSVMQSHHVSRTLQTPQHALHIGHCHRPCRQDSRDAVIHSSSSLGHHAPPWHHSKQVLCNSGGGGSHSLSRDDSMEAPATAVQHSGSVTSTASLLSIGRREGDLSAPMELPIMPLGKVKLPTDLVTLQLFEPRYRLMFRLVNKLGGRNRLFGVILSDRRQGTMESVGALCEMVTFSPLPEQRRIFVLARVVGRFRVCRVISDTPYITATVSRLHDGEDGGGAAGSSHESTRGGDGEQQAMDGAQQTTAATAAVNIMPTASSSGRHQQEPSAPRTDTSASSSTGTAFGSTGTASGSSRGTTEDELMRRIAANGDPHQSSTGEPTLGTAHSGQGDAASLSTEAERHAASTSGADSEQGLDEPPPLSAEHRQIFSDEGGQHAAAAGHFATQVRAEAEEEQKAEAASLAQRAKAEQEAQLVRATEARVWQSMQDVRALASKLYGHMGALGDDTFSIEVRRWCPDPSVLAHHDLPVLDPAVLDVIEVLKLHQRQMPPAPYSPEADGLDLNASSSGRDGRGAAGSVLQQPGQADGSGTAAVALQLASDGRGAVSEAVRQERFSFAALRSCADVSEQQLQAMMYCTSTLARLQLVEAILQDGRQYLAARTALRDVF